MKLRTSRHDGKDALWQFSPKPWGQDVVRSNILYLVIGALVVVVAVLGYELYQDRKQPEGMRIDLGPNGLSIEKT